MDSLSRFKLTRSSPCSLVNRKIGLEFNGSWPHYLQPTCAKQKRGLAKKGCSVLIGQPFKDVEGRLMSLYDTHGL